MLLAGVARRRWSVAVDGRRLGVAGAASTTSARRRARRRSTSARSPTTRRPPSPRSASTATSRPSRTTRRRRPTAQRCVQLAGTTAQTSVIDPNQLSPTFNVEQQLQAYYGFKSTLDIGHYDIDGRSQDVALAVRELRAGGIPQPSWVNNHLVYTHGYGVVAAPTTEVDPKTAEPGVPRRRHAARASRSRSPARRSTSGRRSRASSYAIVGQPAGSTQQAGVRPPGRQRLVGVGLHDLPGRTAASRSARPCAGCCSRCSCSDPNIFFSSELNSASQLLDGARPARPGGQGRAVADARRRRLPRGRRRPDQVDRRRLHDVVELSRLAAGQPAHGQRDDADGQRRVGRAAEHAGQLHAELGEGRRRRLHRQGDAVRVEPAAAPGPAAQDVGIGLPRPGPAAVEHPVGAAAAAALPDRPVQRAALAAGEVPRDAAGELLQRQRLLDGADRPDGRGGEVDQRESSARSASSAAAAVAVHVDVGRRLRRPAATRCPARW